MVPTDWFRWLSARSVRIFDNEPHRPEYLGPSDVVVRTLTADVDKQFAEQLASVDQLRGGGSSLKVGWLWWWAAPRPWTDVAGVVFHPLVTVPVRVTHARWGDAVLQRAGDVELTPLVGPHGERRLAHS